MTAIVNAQKWNDFSISFSQSSISRTASGLWGVKPANSSSNMVLYFINSSSQEADWGLLPSSDYPDLTSDYQVSLFAETDDGKNLYIIALKDNVVRYYLLDVESF
jgi:hypothetical protein